MFNQVTLEMDEASRQRVISELLILHQCKCKHVADFYGQSRQRGPFCASRCAFHGAVVACFLCQPFADDRDRVLSLAIAGAFHHQGTIAMAMEVQKMPHLTAATCGIAF